MTVHALHGALPEWRPDLVAHRNFVSISALTRHLKSRGQKYVGWTQALEGRGDVLTVDDSTQGAKCACLLAREMGHEVILFLNPYQILHQQPYWFCALDWILDNSSVHDVEYASMKLSLRTAAEVRHFRLVVRNRLIVLPARVAGSEVQAIAGLLQASSMPAESHLTTLTMKDVAELASAGVEIATHGCDHRDTAVLSEHELSEDLTESLNALALRFGHVPRLYAVPYGLSRSPIPLATALGLTTFLLDKREDRERLSSDCWNRTEITAMLQKCSPI